jgi:dTDP-4-dehydrorhamnose 3,5-epimerase
MKIEPLSIEGAWLVTPIVRADPRGVFLEFYRFDHLAAEVGHPLRLAQGNVSVSARDVVRGIHFADTPPGQAKYVTCTRGAAIDVIVDIRVGSPTFGRWEAVRLDDVDRRAVYLSEGLGHGYRALSEDTTLTYLCSTEYRPAGEHGVHPLDPDLGIDWGVAAPMLSERDAAAPGLAQMRDAGRLPDYAGCVAYRQELTRRAG